MSEPTPRRVLWSYVASSGLAALLWQLVSAIERARGEIVLTAFPGIFSFALPVALAGTGLVLGWRHRWQPGTAFAMAGAVLAVGVASDAIHGTRWADYLVWAPVAIALALLPVLFGLLVGTNLPRAAHRPGPAEHPDGEIPELRRYAMAASAGITPEGAREDAAEELYQDAVSRYEEAVAGGQEPAQAVQATLRDLGDPWPVARELAKAHRQPLTPLATALLILAGVAFAGFLLAASWLLLSQNGGSIVILLALVALVAAAFAGIAVLSRRAS